MRWGGPTRLTREAAAMSAPGACDACLRRTALIGALAGWLDVEWRRREATARVLALPDEELLGARRSRRPARATSGSRRARPAAPRRRADLGLVCRCDDAYPPRLRDLADPPAVLHVAGTLPPPREEQAAVSIVGARRATSYGLDVSRALGRSLSAAGVPVVSGLALGIDSAAHAGRARGRRRRRGGARLGRRRPVPAEQAAAVRRGPAAGLRGVRAAARLRADAAGASSPATASSPRSRRSRWWSRRRSAPARSRRPTSPPSWAARSAAVPGRITCRQAEGTNGLIQSGAPPVCGVRDVLDLLADATGRPVPERGGRAARRSGRARPGAPGAARTRSRTAAARSAPSRRRRRRPRRCWPGWPSSSSAAWSGGPSAADTSRPPNLTCVGRANSTPCPRSSRSPAPTPAAAPASRRT